MPQKIEHLVTFDPREHEDELVYRHNTTRDHQDVEVSISACNEGINGTGGGCSRPIIMKETTWPGSKFCRFST